MMYKSERHTTLVVGIGEDVEDITKEVDHVLLEELVCNLWRGACKVVDQVKCDYQSAISSHCLIR
jgi:hypothetical protein